MAKIVQYDGPQVQREVSRQPQAQNAPQGAFDQSVGLGALDLAQSALDLSRRIDTTQAEEAVVQFERDKNNTLFDPETGYFNTQGRFAYDGSEQTNTNIDKLKLQHGEHLTGDAKVMYDKAADLHVTRSRVDVSRHAAKGLQVWEVATIESQIENTVENASLYWNDQDRLKVNRTLGRQAIIDSSNITGIGAEATNEKLQTYDSVFAKSVIESAIGVSSDDGVETMSLYGDMLEGPDKADINRKIDSRKAVEKTARDASTAISVATHLTNRYDTRTAIIDEVNRIKDPDLRKQTMNEAMTQHGNNLRAESEARGESFESAEKHILDGGSAESYKLTDPEQWELMSAKQQRSIQSGGTSETDWGSYSDLLTLPPEQLAKVNPSDHFTKLAEPERRSLISAVKSARNVGSTSDKADHQVGRTRAAEAKSTVTQLFGAPNEMSTKQRQQSNSFYSLLDKEVKYRELEKGARLSSTEFTGVLSGLTRTTVEEGLFYDSDIELTDVPQEYWGELSRILHKNGLQATTDSIVKMYNNKVIRDALESE